MLQLRLAALVAFAALPCFCQARGKVFAGLDGKSGPQDVLLVYKQLPGADGEARVKRHGAIKSRFTAAGIIEATVDARGLAEIAADPAIDYIAPNRPVRASLDNESAAIGMTSQIRAQWTGKGIGVAVIDSGIDNHWDLRDSGNSRRVVYEQNFSGGASNDTQDGYGHGTHVATILSGNGTSTNYQTAIRRFFGVAAKVNILNLKVLDRNGMGTDAAVIAAIDRAIALKNSYNVRIINLSLGRRVYESYQVDPLCRAVERAWQSGITVIVAAGNQGRDNSAGTYGYGTVNSPANHPLVIAVGAARSMKTPSRLDDQMASYSAKGPTSIDHIAKPDLVAPGNWVVSATFNSNSTMAAAYPANIVPYQYYLNTTNTGLSYVYYWMSGTSMAAPFVSGAAALLLQKDPSLTPSQIKARLMKTAWKGLPSMSVATDPVTGQTYTVAGDVFTVGAGYLDVGAALQSNEKAAGTAASPEVVKVSGELRLQFGSSALWGESAPWSARDIYGPAVFLGGTTALWGENVTQGSSALWGDSALWGESALWGDSALWGESTAINSLKAKGDY